MTAPNSPPSPVSPAAAAGATTAWGIIVFAFSAAGAALLGFAWLFTLVEGAMLIWLWLISMVLAPPTLALAVAAFVIVILASQRGQRGIVAMSITALVCDVPLLIVLAVLQPFGMRG